MLPLLFASFLACGDDDRVTDAGATDARVERDGSVADGGVATGVCARESAAEVDGARVTRCEELFPERPYVRPPADVRSGSSVALYAAFTSYDETAFVDRDGTEYLLVDDGGPIPVTDAARMPAGIRWPSYRFLYTIYLVRGETAPLGDRTSIRVESATAAITITGEAIDSLALGTWEGTVSRRIGENMFDFDQRVPFRVTFDRVEPHRFLEALPEWDEPDTLLAAPEATLVRTRGSIDNWESGVRAAGGGCLEGVRTLGEATPFPGTPVNDVSLYRYPFMHFPGDYVTVFDYPTGSAELSGNGMTGLYFNHPAALLQNEARAPWDRWDAFPHATPNGHSIDAMVKVEAGGDPC
jgi:hypothetical protein